MPPEQIQEMTKKVKAQSKKKILKYKKSDLQKWQFYSDHSLLLLLHDKICETLDPENELAWNVSSSLVDKIPEAVLDEYNRQLESGFAAWTKNDFNAFLECYLEHETAVVDQIDY